MFTPLWNGVLSGANLPSSRQNPSVTAPPGHLTFSNRTALTFSLLLASSSSLATPPWYRHVWLRRTRRTHPSLPPPSRPSFHPRLPLHSHDNLKMEEMCFSWPAFPGCCLNNGVARSTKLNSTSPWRAFLRRATPQHNQGNPTIRRTSPSPQRLKVNAICLTANQIASGHAGRACACSCVYACAVRSCTPSGVKDVSVNQERLKLLNLGEQIRSLTLTGEKPEQNISPGTQILHVLWWKRMKCVSYRSVLSAVSCAVASNCLVTTPLWCNLMNHSETLWMSLIAPPQSSPLPSLLFPSPTPSRPPPSLPPHLPLLSPNLPLGPWTNDLICIPDIPLHDCWC